MGAITNGLSIAMTVATLIVITGLSVAVITAATIAVTARSIPVVIILATRIAIVMTSRRSRYVSLLWWTRSNYV